MTKAELLAAVEFSVELLLVMESSMSLTNESSPVLDSSNGVVACEEESFNIPITEDEPKQHRHIHIRQYDMHKIALFFRLVRIIILLQLHIKWSQTLRIFTLIKMPRYTTR